MSSDVVYTAVHTFLDANFSVCPLVYENEGTTQLPEPPSPWVLIEIYGNFYDQVSMGSGSPLTDKWREQGAVLAHVMTPVNTGTLRARQIATQLTELFRGLRIEPDIRFADLSIGAGQTVTEDGNWYPLSCRYEWARG